MTKKSTSMEGKKKVFPNKMKEIGISEKPEWIYILQVRWAPLMGKTVPWLFEGKKMFQE